MSFGGMGRGFGRLNLGLLGRAAGSTPAAQDPVQYIVSEYPILVFVNDPPSPRPATQSTLVV